MTTIDYEEIDATESVSHSELCSVTSLETESTTFNVAMVRHSQPVYLPLLILLQYISTAWISEVIMTNFDSPNIHHSCVSIKFMNLNLINIFLSWFISLCISFRIT